jgi:hypothetical protein
MFWRYPDVRRRNAESVSGGTAGGPGVALASGGAYPGHAAWHQLRGLVANRLSQLGHCTQGD